MKFLSQFHVARKKAELQERLSSLRFMLSEASLQLLPEYKQRIQVWESRHGNTWGMGNGESKFGNT